jgi:hypothetical protein
VNQFREVSETFKETVLLGRLSGEPFYAYLKIAFCQRATAGAMAAERIRDEALPRIQPVLFQLISSFFTYSKNDDTLSFLDHTINFPE